MTNQPASVGTKRLPEMLRHPLISSVLTALLTAVLTLSATVFVLDRRDQADKATHAFRDQSRAFEAVTANYVGHMLDDQKPDRGATDQLTANVFAQIHAMDDAAKYLPTRDSRLSKEYDDELSSLLRIIPRTTNVVEMRDFWEQVSKVLVLRNEVLSKLPS